MEHSEVVMLHELIRVNRDEIIRRCRAKVSTRSVPPPTDVSRSHRSSTAIIAFEVLETGNVGVAGSTGTVLHRSLLGARTLIGRSLAEVRLTHGVQHREQFLVSDFIDELAPAATLDARARGIGLAVAPVDDGVAIEATDRSSRRWWETCCKAETGSIGALKRTTAASIRATCPAGDASSSSICRGFQFGPPRSRRLALTRIDEDQRLAGGSI